MKILSITCPGNVCKVTRLGYNTRGQSRLLQCRNAEVVGEEPPALLRCFRKYSCLLTLAVIILMWTDMTDRHQSSWQFKGSNTFNWACWCGQKWEISFFSVHECLRSCERQKLVYAALRVKIIGYVYAFQLVRKHILANMCFVFRSLGWHWKYGANCLTLPVYLHRYAVFDPTNQYHLYVQHVLTIKADIF